MKPVLVFVYGTLKKGRSNHRVMGNSELMFKHVTDPIYTMVTNGGFPIVKRGGTTPITGEVYKVTDENTLNRIYRLEGCTGIKGHPDNWYDIDHIKIDKRKKASIFVMDADKYTYLPVIENGIF